MPLDLKPIPKNSGGQTGPEVGKSLPFNWLVEVLFFPVEGPAMIFRF